VEELKISPNYLEFSVEGNPVPKARPVTRFKDGGRVRTFTPRTTEAWEAAVAFAANRAMHGSDPLHGNLAITLRFYRKDRAACDLDNLAKAVLDAVQARPDAPFGICFLDDRQIVELHLYKSTDRDRPRVEVTVQQIIQED